LVSKAEQGQPGGRSKAAALLAALCVNNGNRQMCIFSKNNKYLKDGRLEDVLALIQVLALDEYAHRSEDGLKAELQSKPKSANSWTDLAKEHLEFFRVLKDGKNAISLVLRHVSEDTGIKRSPLHPEQTQALLNTAIELHDREIRRNQRWAILIPIWVAVIGGIVVLLSAWLNKCPPNT
jgi:Flp pilus assembly protein CpaB